MTSYAEFRVRIERLGGRAAKRSYRVEVSGVAGNGEGRLRLPFTETELENFVLKVGRTRRGVRRLESPEMQLAKDFGGRLFRALMDGQVGERYREALGAARANRTGLRITLSLTTVPELGAVPWEYLFDSTDFLSISATTPVVRYLDVPMPTRPLDVELPLRILAVISAPSNAESLDTAGERAKLESALEGLVAAGAVAVDWLEKPNLLALSQRLRGDAYHILHFIGHGGFDDVSGEGGLLFEDASGQGRPVSGDQLAAVVRDKLNLRLVLLNSCEGARNSVKDPFSGVAASLVERGIPAVIGMQFEITDRAAVLFASEFYAILAEGKPVDEAVAGARLAIFADHNDVEWATPVLFMRVEDGRLFKVADAQELPHGAPAALPPKTAGTDDAPAAEPPAAEPPAAVAGDAPDERAGAGGEAPPARRVESVEVAAADAAAAAGGAGAVDADEPASGAPAGMATTADPPAWVEADPELGRLIPDGHGGGTVPSSHDGGVSAGTDVGGPIAAAIPAEAAPLPSLLRRRGVPWRIVAVAVAVVAALLAGVLLLQPGPAETGSLDVNTAGVLQTGRIRLSGTDFGPRETVDITLNGDPVLSVQTSAAGAFSAELEVDYMPMNVAEAVGRTSGRQARTFFSLPEPGSSGAPTEGAVPTETSPGILFWSDISSVDGNAVGTDTDLYLLNPVTRQVTALSATPADDSYPTWSPDYGQIAYTRATDEDGQILVRDRDSDELGRLVSTGEHDEYFPAWSRDGWIAYVRRESSESSAIWAVRSDGSDGHEVVRGKVLRAPAWSPDGTRIAFFGRFDDDGPWHLYSVKVDGTEPTQLTFGTRNDRNPNWSPDGRTIVFVRGDESTSPKAAEIHLLDVETGRVSDPLTSNDVQDGNPVWSPDGTQIAFYRQSDDGYHLWLMNADGSGQEDLMPGWLGKNLDPIWR